MASRRPLLVSAALAAVLVPGLLAGCSSSGNSAAMTSQTGVPTARVGHLEKTTITVYAVPTTDTTGLYVAQYEGYFKAQGLTVNIQPAVSAETVINEMALGKIDMVAGNYVSFIEAQQNYDDGARPNPSNTSPTYQQIAANLDLFAEGSELEPNFQGLFVPADSSVKSISQLKGKVVAVNASGGVGYVMVASALLAAGIQPSTVKWTDVPFQNMASELMAGKIAAAFLPEPFNSIDSEDYGLTSLSDLDVGLTTNFPVEGYAVTKAWAKKYPNTLTAFYRALEQGQEMADTDRRIAEKATEVYVPGLTPAVASILTMETYPVGAVDESRLQRVSDDMQLLRLSSTSMVYNVQQMIGDNGLTGPGLTPDPSWLAIYSLHRDYASA
jgi:NitT/TauT family transport system substrate-binding protein